MNINRFNMHPSEFALLPAAFGEREREGERESLLQ